MAGFLSHPSTWNPRFTLRADKQPILGSGTYGQVVRVTDATNGQDVALKISRKEPPYRRSALTEVDVLLKLRGNPYIIRYVDHFQTTEGYVHSVVEMLDCNLYEYLRENQFRVVPLKQVRAQAECIAKGLLALHQCGYMHCDIKPENVMVRRRSRPEELCLIDFGSARKFFENQYYDVQSLWYRAPEVICGVPYTTAVDMWSLGCLLYELHTGGPLFPGDDPQHSLQLMIAVVGLPSRETLSQGTLCRQLQFTPSTDPELIYVMDPSRFSGDEQSIAQFHDLLLRLLHPDPAHRMTAAEMLKHPFLTQGTNGDSGDSVYLANGSIDSMGGPSHGAACAEGRFPPAVGGVVTASQPSGGSGVSSGSGNSASMIAMMPTSPSCMGPPTMSSKTIGRGQGSSDSSSAAEDPYTLSCISD